VEEGDAAVSASLAERVQASTYILGALGRQHELAFGAGRQVSDAQAGQDSLEGTHRS